MAEHIEVARAFVTIVPSLEGSQASISSELTGITNDAADKAGAESGTKFGDKFASALKGAGATIAGAMAAATGAAVATGKAFIDSANDVAAYGDQVDKMSQKMGISATAYQEWDFVMQHAGTSIDSLKSSMKTLATAAETDNAAFETLGITQEQIAEMSQEDLFSATISALQNVSDETERTYFAGQLLGKGATELGALFNMSAEETDALKQQVHDLGGVMSDEAVADAAAYQDAMQNMETSLSGLKNSMMSEFLPGMTSVMEGLAKVFSGDSSGLGEIQSGLTDVINNITELAPEFFSLAETLITSLISGFAPMLPQLVSSIFSVLVQGITTITGMIPQMMPSIIAGIQGIMSALFEALPVIIQGLTTLVMSLITWLSEGENVTNFVNGIIQLATMICDQIAVILPVLLPAIVRIISEVAIALTEPNNVMMIIGAVINIVVAVVQALIAAFPEIVNLVGGLLENASDLLLSFVDWIYPFIAQALDTIISTVTGWGDSIKNFLSTLVTNIWNGIQTWLTNMKNGFQNAFNTIKEKVSNVVNKIKEFATNILEKLGELPKKVVEIGKNLITGLWNGIQDKAQWCINQLKRLGESIVNTVKSIFGVASPSKVFAQIGGYLAEGLGEGYEDGMEDVKKDILASSEQLTGNMTASVTAYGSGSQMLGGNTTTYNGGGVTINVYGAEGQNVNDLARHIAAEFEHMTRRKGAIYA